ncbi:hypothetical protein PTKIN_Ptkin11bG0180200 [Pterospermum kingtungense]
MANFEVPSFSLGLDLDADPEPTGDHSESILAAASPVSFSTLEHNADELDSELVMDSDPETRPDPPRVLKRLRRVADKSSATKKESEKTSVGNDGDDEIEEFSSSPEKNDVGSSTRYHSVCSSSKIPLKGLGLLTTQSSSQWSSKKKEQASVDQSSKAGHDGLIFPKLTISPLRRFQLLDSDSDDPSDHKDTGKGSQKIDPLSKEQQSTPSDKKGNTSFGASQNEDLWKDFSPMNSSPIRTPAFDEFCKEYFQPVKDKNATQNLGSQKMVQVWDLDDPLPPAHLYFFHADPRIQKLVRSRLPFFSPPGMVNSRGNEQPTVPPLGTVHNRGHQQPNVSFVDSVSQFGNGESSRRRGSQRGRGKRCSTSRSKSNKSNAEESASAGWIDPKSSGAIPKNAGKRRVHASGQPAGHWYTSPEGRKVYITKSGQELSGQMAYRHYRKESGAGFRKSKKKSNVKKKKG